MEKEDYCNKLKYLDKTLFAPEIAFLFDVLYEGVSKMTFFAGI